MSIELTAAYRDCIQQIEFAIREDMGRGQSHQNICLDLTVQGYEPDGENNYSCMAIFNHQTTVSWKGSVEYLRDTEMSGRLGEEEIRMPFQDIHTFLRLPENEIFSYIPLENRKIEASVVDLIRESVQKYQANRPDTVFYSLVLKVNMVSSNLLFPNREGEEKDFFDLASHSQHFQEMRSTYEWELPLAELRLENVEPFLQTLV